MDNTYSCGNAMQSTFMSNPQYALIVPAATGGPEERVQVQVVLETIQSPDPCASFGYVPWKCRSGRVTNLTEGDVVLSSGMYHHGLACALPHTQLQERQLVCEQERTL